MHFSKKQVVVSTILVCAILLLFGVYVFQGRETSNQEFSLGLEEEREDLKVKDKQKVQATTQQTTVLVDVKGAVKTPGVYELAVGSRIRDAIRLSGGITNQGDKNAVNLALKLQDEMIVYVPKIGESESVVISSHTSPGTSSNTENPLINLNTATPEELQQLDGVGPAKASAIIAYREENGPFQKIEDLMNVSGIGQKSFDKLKESIRVQ
ncbi:helix-hairpin-helix domain-containing protein [Priestia koreensis]|uniref:helix-hairpin-helix domain-containing protein n=1 Tax=Priestia koreensis TaxID=284581 RepID=UPI00345A171C